MKKLKLEYRERFNGEVTFKAENNTVMITPPIDEYYWTFKIPLHKEQALVAFHKFGTLGIGFAIEDDWNTNLPYTCDTNKIADHIWHNRKYPQITKKILIEAIEILKKAATYYKTHEEPSTFRIADISELSQYTETLKEKMKK